MLCVDMESFFILAACRYIYDSVPEAYYAMVEIPKGYKIVDRLFVEEAV